MFSPFRLSLERKPGSHVGCSLRPRLISPAGLCLFVLPEHSSRKRVSSELPSRARSPHFQPGVVAQACEPSAQRLRQEDQEFKAALDHTRNSKQAWAT